MTNVRVITKALSEADFQTRVMDYAKLRGWMVCHYRPAAHSNGPWRTPLQGDAGAPDLILARAGRVLLVELKSDSGHATEAQDRWLGAAGVNGRLWKPKHWDQIVKELS